MTSPTSRAQLTRGKRVVFILTTVLFAALGTLSLVLSVDIYFHERYERSGGLNVWGYRGPVASHKQANERRIVVVGGSTAFGYGVVWDQAFPAVLERDLNATRASKAQRVSVINLAYNNEGAYSFKYTLRDYAYLNYDVVIVYTGYNDLGGHNTQVVRHQSPVFRLTGYMPIIPVIFSEKAMALRNGADLEGAYAHKKTTFVASPGERAAATALETADSVAGSLAKQLGRLTSPDVDTRVDGITCAGDWDFYCQQVDQTVELALSSGKTVVVVTEPYIADRHVEQQAAMAQMLRQRFAGNGKVVYVNLGRVVDLKDRSLAWDGMHLTVEGNKRIAQALEVPIREVVEQQPFR
jgi:lysophospholipase L1-like esterase